MTTENENVSEPNVELSDSDNDKELIKEIDAIMRGKNKSDASENNVDKAALEKEPQDNTPAGEKEDEEIDPQQVKIARELGFTDAQIIDIATNNPIALERLTQSILQDDSVPQTEISNDDIQKTKNEELTEEIKTGLDLGDLSEFDPDLVEKIVKPLTKRLTEVEGQLKLTQEVEAQAKQKEIDAINAGINADFDKFSEVYPALGMTENMTPKQFKVRSSILEEALVLANQPSRIRNKISWQENLSQAAKNLLGEPVKVKENKNNKNSGDDKKSVSKLFTNRPTGRKTESNKSKSEEEQDKELINTISAIQRR
jgi:hypothetical protein